MNDEIAELKIAIEKFAKDRDWGQFHTPKNLSMGLAAEAAEVLEIFQWLTAAQSERLPKAKVADLADELADTYIYLLKLAGHYDIDLVAAAHKKIEKNSVKYPVGKARGSAKKYSEL